MYSISKLTKFIPYLYFLSVITYWFTTFNKLEGIIAYPILLCGIPFIWQLFKPSRQLNFSLGIIFVCLSSYLVFAYLFNILHILNWTETIEKILFYSGILVVGNVFMSLWMIRNSMNKVF
ncbi:hypothetical protein [Winogradskyella endarachnes]|uniref:DUF2069 domain-containing protein n=1 Tax=Winogradskyella endarachnes TaxID=2681965 RepID=A0A6L6UCG1_9FLAO|nr:hypothetical protein [Winogradskyella endarachnes]MUU79659.1 hypothetical protein [Winogradskyella endarachnes]